MQKQGPHASRFVWTKTIAIAGQNPDTSRLPCNTCLIGSVFSHLQSRLYPALFVKLKRVHREIIAKIKCNDAIRTHVVLSPSSKAESFIIVAKQINQCGPRSFSCHLFTDSTFVHLNTSTFSSSARRHFVSGAQSASLPRISSRHLTF